MSEDIQNKQYSGPERRSERRLEIDKRLNATVDWLTSLDERVAKGLISNERKKQLIAGSLVAREIFTEKANDRSRKDSMTGLKNKGAFDEEIGKLIDNRLPFGLLIIDIDHFKNVNDTYGHAAGDSVLIQTARNLTSNLRQIRSEDMQNDQIFRIGGEEFSILLPGEDKEENLKNVAEKIRLFIGNFPYSVKKDEKDINIPIAVSIGGGINRQESAEVFLKKVDMYGLYEAKNTGRNKTIIVPNK